MGFKGVQALQKLGGKASCGKFCRQKSRRAEGIWQRLLKWLPTDGGWGKGRPVAVLSVALTPNATQRSARLEINK